MICLKNFVSTCKREKKISNRTSYFVLYQKIFPKFPFFSFIFSIGLLYYFFHYLIKEKVFLLNKKLDQFAGFGWARKSFTIFKSSLVSEIISFIKYIYYLVDKFIISLPTIKL